MRLDPPEALDVQPGKPPTFRFQYLSILNHDIFWCWTTTVASSDPIRPYEKKKKPGTFDLAADSAVVDLFQDHQAFHLMAESENRKG